MREGQYPAAPTEFSQNTIAAEQDRSGGAVVVREGGGVVGHLGYPLSVKGLEQATVDDPVQCLLSALDPIASGRSRAPKGVRIVNDLT